MKLDYAKLNLRQKENLEAAIRAYQTRSSVSGHSPVALFLELTQNCIAKCAFCHGSNWENHPSFNMPPNLFNIILRNYVPYAVLVDLRGRGESLMLPNFPDYLQRIAQHGPKIRIISTLGCGTKEVLQMLVDYDVFVAVSFDAADKNLYENTRPGIKYDIVMENLEFLARQMFFKYGTLEDKIRIDICPLQKKNLPYIESVLTLAHRLGIRDILIGPLVGSSYCPDLLINNKFLTVKALEECIRFAKDSNIRFRLIKPPFDEFRLKEKVFDRCCHPWFHALITFRGDLIFCDHLLGPTFNKYVLGNICESKETLWNGKKAQQLRMSHIYKDEDLPHPCRRCYCEGRYTEFEEILCDNFQKYIATEREIAFLIQRLGFKKCLFLISDFISCIKILIYKFIKRNLPLLYMLGKKVKNAKWR